MRSAHVDVLGPFLMRCDDRSVELPRRRRSLLGLLALRAGDVVTVDQLIDGLWGEEAPPTAVRTLHSHIAKLRASLAEHGMERAIRRQEPGYTLAADAVLVDRTRFEELVASGRDYGSRGRFAEALSAYEAALACWRGEVLADCVVYEWATAEAAYLAELRLHAHEGLLAARLATGKPDLAIGEIERLLGEHPLRERLWELLMIALQLSGRTGDALVAYQRARRALIDDLGIEPGEGLRRTESAVLRGVADPRTLLRLEHLAAQRPASLPRPLNPLIGRQVEIATVSALLDDSRLVTLTGFGGSGKTRLAVEVAAAAQDGFDQVHFVDLAAVRRAEHVSTAVAEALGVREQPGADLVERLVRRIDGTEMLIVLDNCEHLVGACARLVHGLLSGCGRLKVLATSQEALRIPGEAAWLVPPLSTPDPAAVRTAADLAGFGAVALFAAHAGIPSVRELSSVEARALAAICARCEGLPLAIELAAARTRILSLPEIARCLRNRFTLLADGPRTAHPRHRAMRTTVEWSYSLLTEEERAAIRRASVFSGSFTLDAAGGALGVLGRLVDKSLLKVVSTADGMRYQLLETIRDYAAEQLAADQDERVAAAREHAAFYLQLAEDVEQRLQGPDLGPIMVRTAADHGNLRAALTWLTGEGGDQDSALRLAAALWRYHYLRGHYSEGRAWLRSALAKTGKLSPALAKAYCAAATLAALECDYDEAGLLAQRSLEAGGDKATIARAKTLLGSIARERGGYRRAIDLGQESLACFEAAGDIWGTGHALQLLGFASWLSGDHVAAARWSGRAYELLGKVGDTERRAWCLIDLGAVALYRGEPDEALRKLWRALTLFHEVRFKEGIAWAENLLALVELDIGSPRIALRRLALSLRLHGELGDRWRQASVMEALARGAYLVGQSFLGAELLGAALTIRADIGTPVPTCERPVLEETRARIRKEIGDKAFERLFSAGRVHELEHLQDRVADCLAG